MSDHEHEHTHAPGEAWRHTHYSGASLVNAMTCSGCGCFVNGDRLDEHTDFHRVLAQLVDSSSTSPHAKGKKSAAKGSGGKKA